MATSQDSANRLRAALAQHGTQSARGSFMSRQSSLSMSDGGSSRKPSRTNIGAGRRTLTTGDSPGKHKKRVSTSFMPGKSKSVLREIGADELILSNLLVDGAVWSTERGLYVDRSICGLTRLPSLRVRAATPRAAEYVIHQLFPQSHGCLELPVRRVLKSPWPLRGAVSGCVEADEMLLVRLPFVWGDANQVWHPTALYDALPLQFSDESASLSPLPESGGGGRAGASGDATHTGASNERRQQGAEGRMRAPRAVSRPFSLHPAAAAGLVAGCSSMCLPAAEDV